MKRAFHGRIGGSNAAGDGVAESNGKSAGDAVEAGRRKTFVSQAKFQVFERVGDLARVEAQDLGSLTLGKHCLEDTARRAGIQSD